MVKLDMSLYRLSVFKIPDALDAVHSFGTCALGIFGSSGPLVSAEEDAPPVSVGIGEGAEAGACAFGGANKFGRSEGGADSWEKGLDGAEVSAAGVDISFEGSAGVD
jgi:hypothetical protein